jgi:transcriptional regulator GlxA family with amidase domain
LAESYPDVRVDPAPIWVKDGKFYTSAGITSGIDLALSLIAEDFGDRLALAISKTLVLFLRRPGGQAQFSVALSSQRASSPTLRELCDWITGQLQNDLTIEALADHLSISVRSVIRIFRRELNTTPARYVEDIRLEAVRRALELGTQSLKKIAGQCGYRSLDVMRKAFLRRIGVSPNEYARRFSSLGDGNLRHPAL